MDPLRLEPLFRSQDGVVARRQVLAAGLDDNDIERLLRRRVWARVHQGVYVDHTGPLSSSQRWWAAVLSCWPAALYGETALLAYGVLPTWRGAQPVGDARSTVHVAVEHPRKVTALPGVTVHRMVGLGDQVLWNLGPPRLRLEQSVLTACAAAPSRSAALAIAADMCQQRRTTAARLLDAMGASGRQRHGAWLRKVLHDVASGAMSLLEHGYLRLERTHGLPPAKRQRREDGESVYRDARYPGLAMVVELDGRLGHEWTDDRWRDMDRDLDAGADGDLTIRLGWRHVIEDSCRTADRLGRALRHRGWTGDIRPCGPTCAVTSSQPGRSPAPRADDRPA